MSKAKAHQRDLLPPEPATMADLERLLAEMDELQLKLLRAIGEVFPKTLVVAASGYRCQVVARDAFRPGYVRVALVDHPEWQKDIHVKLLKPIEPESDKKDAGG